MTQKSFLIISLEKVIFSTFPIGIALLIHKFLLLFFSFFGTYQLFRKVFKFEKLESLFEIALSFKKSHEHSTIHLSGPFGHTV